MAETWSASAEESSIKSRDPNSGGSDPSGVVDVVALDESDLDESSGLAVSRRRHRHFWTHNDSGGAARLSAFNASGQKTGQVELNSTAASDWEDVASFTDGGVPRLLIADCGDNKAERSSIILYLLDEPDPTESVTRDADQTLSVVYPDGPRDCEAVAVDPHRRQILLIAKSALPAAGMYVVPLPAGDEKSAVMNVTAKRVGTLPLPMVTAMDIDQASGDVWVVSYFQAFQFRCAHRDIPFARQMLASPTPHELPRWKQIESVAVDEEHDIWVTSEGSPAPLGRLPQNHTQPQRATQRP